eukprot:351092-Chlamydomonas_euryale.AAC.2
MMPLGDAFGLRGLASPPHCAAGSGRRRVGGGGSWSDARWAEGRAPQHSRGPNGDAAGGKRCSISRTRAFTAQKSLCFVATRVGTALARRGGGQGEVDRGQAVVAWGGLGRRADGGLP